MNANEMLAKLAATMGNAGDPLSDLQYEFLCGMLLTQESLVTTALRTACHMLTEERNEIQTKIFLDNVTVIIGDLHPRGH